jgi:hypothetical protein
MSHTSRSLFALSLFTLCVAARTASADCTPQTWYFDGDRDGFGTPARSVSACLRPIGFVGRAGDCNDTNASVNPSAQEVCNGLDDDCDGGRDVNAVDATPWYADADRDGYGLGSSVVMACRAPEGYVASSGDCDDTRRAVNPGAVERCNRLDDDCDGEINEDAVDRATWYMDLDGDGYGVADGAVLACEAPAGFVAMAGDCDDSTDAMSPGLAEMCGDGIDNNCDGGAKGCVFEGRISRDDADVGVDLNADVPFAADSLSGLGDTDGDGYGDLLVGSSAGSYVLRGPVLWDGDLSDASAAILPRPGEACRVEAVGDLDDDGTADLLDFTWGAGVAGRISLLSGPIEGYLPGADIEEETGFKRALYLGDTTSSRDLTGDGIDDLVLIGSDAGSLSLLILAGPFTSLDEAMVDAVRITGLPLSYDAYRLSYGGDVDGDGVGDLVVGVPVDAPAGEPSDGAVLVFHGPFLEDRAADEADAWITGAEGSFAGWDLDATRDLDGDGAAEILLSAPNHRVTDELGNLRVGAVLIFGGGAEGDLELDEARARILGPSVPRAIFDGSDPIWSEGWFATNLSVGDVDGDGSPDLLVGSASGRAFLLSGPIGPGTDSGSAAATFEMPGSMGRILGDLDEDGYADLAFLDRGVEGNFLRVYYGLGI